MKKQFRLLFTLFVMTCISFSAGAINYSVTFTGSGASTTVDSVIVQNLSKGTEVTIKAGSQLGLYDAETSIDALNTIADFASVYPNPMTDNATFSFVAKHDGNTQVSVFSIDGRKVAGIDMHLREGKNSFQLTLSKGVYLVQAKGNGFTYTARIISLSMTESRPSISFSAFTSDSKPQKIPVPEVKLQYTSGDQILYKGYSGNYCTIITDKPTDTKTIDFKFTDCTDADGNHYAVVKIGTQTWMAENLKTTKYRNGQDINANTIFYPAYQFAYENDVNNAAKYGRLYTWSATIESRNIAPEGWHVASNAEWTDLQNNMITNGFNYDGTTTDNKIAKSLATSTDWGNFTDIGTVGNNLSKNNSSGFSALPAGSRGTTGTYATIGFYGHWWTSTAYSALQGMYWSLYYTNFDLVWNHIPMEMCFSVRCVKDEIPTLTTTTVTGIETTTAVSGGEISSEGTSTVTERGVCWSKNQNPTIANSKTSNGTSAGIFTSSLTGLTANTTYYARAYATNGVGTAYGNEVSFKTLAAKAIGDLYLGGKIAYLDASGIHGFVCALTDQSTGIPWWNGVNITIGGTFTALETSGVYGISKSGGRLNTDAIILKQGLGTYAASICAALTIGDATPGDWYLPSQGELNQMFVNRTIRATFLNELYWSSSEYGYGFSWAQWFGTGNQTFDNKNNGGIYVRAIRAF